MLQPTAVLRRHGFSGSFPLCVGSGFFRWVIIIITLNCLAGDAFATCLKMLNMRFADVQPTDVLCRQGFSGSVRVFSYKIPAITPVSVRVSSDEY